MQNFTKADLRARISAVGSWPKFFPLNFKNKSSVCSFCIATGTCKLQELHLYLVGYIYKKLDLSGLPCLLLLSFFLCLSSVVHVEIYC